MRQILLKGHFISGQKKLNPFPRDAKNEGTMHPDPETTGSILIFRFYRNYGLCQYFCTMALLPVQEIRSWPFLYKALAVFALLLISCERLWFLFHRGIHLDEAYTFIKFTYQGIWRSMSYYPVPNNHVFLTVITAVFYHVTGSPFWSLRLPALLISFLATVYIFFQVYRHTSFWVAFTGVCLFCFSYHGLFYSIHARGYFLIAGFSVMAAFSVFDFVQTRKRKYLLPSLVASCLGFYTVPVFLYPFLSLLVFGAVTLWIRKQTRSLLELAFASAIAGVLTLLLYLPVFVVSGLNAVIGNEFVVPVKFRAYLQNFMPWFREMGNTVTGREPEGYLLMLFILGGLLFTFLLSLKKYGKGAFMNSRFLVGFLMLCMLLVPLAALTVQMVLPPSRVFLYLGVFQFVALAWLLEKISRHLKATRFFPVITLLLVGVYGAHQVRVLYLFPANQLYLYDDLVPVIKAIEKSNPKRIFAQEGNVIFFTQNATSQLDKPTIRIDHKHYDPAIPYDYIMVEVQDSLRNKLNLKGYREIHNDGYLVFYKRQ
jgi:hypothetical protein